MHLRRLHSTLVAQLASNKRLIPPEFSQRIIDDYEMEAVTTCISVTATKHSFRLTKRKSTTQMQGKEKKVIKLSERVFTNCPLLPPPHSLPATGDDDDDDGGDDDRQLNPPFRSPSNPSQNFVRIFFSSLIHLPPSSLASKEPKILYRPE